MRRCTRCIMDESDPLIVFDAQGVCNHCHEYDEVVKDFGYNPKTSPKEHDAIIEMLKQEGQGKEYDCIIGISGGVDSCFLLHHAVTSGLRVLAVHVDAGWNSDTAVRNIHKLCKKLDVELHTIVIDWPTIKELQRAYMFSGVANLDIPQDHVFISAMYKYALKNKVKYMLNGSNLATEGILPNAWGYDNLDYENIKDIFKKHKRKGNLRKYPHFGVFKYYLYYLKRTERINLLNYIPYSKQEAIKTLSELYGWEYYGGKHFESRFTKFFQSYYLPVKFGYDKRMAHLASLVVGGEMTREEALKQFEHDQPYDEAGIVADRDYILKKLDISIEEWETIMASPNKTEDDYKNNKHILHRLKFIAMTVCKVKNLFKGKKQHV